MENSGVYSELTVKTVYGEKRVFLPAGYFCTDALPQRLHRYHEPEVHLLRGGEARFVIGGEPVTLQSGGMLVIPGGVFRRCEACTPGAQHLVFRVESAVKRSRIYPLEPALSDAVLAAFSGAAENGDFVEAAAWLALLCSRFCVGEPPMPCPVEDYGVLIGEFFAARYGEALRMKDFAQALGVTTRHAERLVLQHTGNTFGKELTLVRTEAAKQLRQEGVLSPEEIAAYVGYSSQAAFEKALKKYGLAESFSAG